MTDLSTWSLAFVLLVFVSYALSLVVLRRAARVGWGGVFLAAFGMCAWLAATGAMAGSGLLVRDVTAVPPLIMRYVLAPALFVVVVLASLPATGRVLDRMPGDWLVSFQANRIAVEVILHGLFVAGAAPQRLTYAGWNFDIATGIGALVVGYLMHKGRAPAAVVLGFNLIGLALLVVIVTMAVLSMPTPLQVFSDTPELRVVFHVPFVWLPGLVVPLALLMHLLSLRKWFRERRGRG